MRSRFKLEIIKIKRHLLRTSTELNHSIFFPIIAGCLAAVAPVWAAKGATCQQVFQQQETAKGATAARQLFRISIAPPRFMELLHGQQSALLKTLSSDVKALTKAWRSEWKQKLSIEASNRLTDSMIRAFLTPETQRLVLKGLSTRQSGFVREVHSRLWQLQQSKQLKEEDQLTVRDAPSPKGVDPLNFTYYLPALTSVIDGTQAKHQFRVRTYLLQVQPAQMDFQSSTIGQLPSGEWIELKRISSSQFEVGLRGSAPNGPVKSVQRFTGVELQKIYGHSLVLRAPHGSNFNLEIKTSLPDQISTPSTPLLNGPHMVQKLDLKISDEVLRSLLRRDLGLDASQEKERKLEQLKAFEAQLIEQNPSPETSSFIRANIEVLIEALTAKLQSTDLHGLQANGVTSYNRTAFQGRVAVKGLDGRIRQRPTFQLTVDRMQNLRIGNMYLDQGELRAPRDIVAEFNESSSGIEDARHVELKVTGSDIGTYFGLKGPSLLNGVNSISSVGVLSDRDDLVAGQLIKVTSLFHSFLRRNTYLRRLGILDLHRGKFNYGRWRMDQLEP